MNWSTGVSTREEILHAALDDTPVLTVGEDEEFIDEGGVVQFYLEGNKVRFAFNLNEVQERELKVSSKLLSLAKIVGSGESTGAVGQFAQ